MFFVVVCVMFGLLCLCGVSVLVCRCVVYCVVYVVVCVVVVRCLFCLFNGVVPFCV